MAVEDRLGPGEQEEDRHHDRDLRGFSRDDFVFWEEEFVEIFTKSTDMGTWHAYLITCLVDENDVIVFATQCGVECDG